jgi:hypothetical protein
MASSTLKNWVVVNPSSGASGSTSVALSAAAYYGRLARTTVTLKVDAAELTGHSSADTTFTVTQAGRGNYMSLGASSIAIAKGGGTATISGECNWASMYVTTISGDTSYISGYSSSMKGSLKLTINSASSAQNQGAISGDPGATGLYTWKLDTIALLANSTIASKTIKIILSPTSTESTESVTITITIAEGDPYVTLSTNAITIPYAGTAQTLTVTSNTNWSITE